MNSAARAGLRIGDLCVYPAIDEIQKDGVTIKLEPRAMRLLMCLAERSGHVVSVEELLESVWKDVIVSPDSVYAAVAALRRILGEDPKNPTYIANVPRRGYRLIASVSPLEPPVSRAVPDPAGVGAEEIMPPAASADERAAPELIARPPHDLRLTKRSTWALILGSAVLFLLAVGAFRWNASHAHRIAAAPPQSPAKSVAVLPFLDMSEKRDEQYFADGMSEELIDLLARVPDLKVPARTSSFSFKGKQATIEEIARALGVSHVLEGSVRKSGDTLRITAQLVRADNGYHEWSETYDRPMSDIFKIQDEIAGEVVRSLKAQILPDTQGQTPPTTNSAAYTLLLKAQAISNGGSTADYELAKTYVQQALILDPHFGAGWGLLGALIVWEFNWGDRTHLVEDCLKASHAADEALRLDPQAVYGHIAKANVYAECDWDSEGAVREFRLAVPLDPAKGWRGLAQHYLALPDSYGDRAHRAAEALRFATRSAELDPLNPYSYWTLAIAQGDAGDLKGAEASWRKAIELDSTAAGVHALRANSLLALKRPEDALKELALESDAFWRDENLTFIYDALGRRADADRAFADFRKKYGDDRNTMGLFYACRGDVESALKWVEGDYAARVQFGTDVPNRHACWQNLEHDSRYRELYRQMYKRYPD